MCLPFVSKKKTVSEFTSTVFFIHLILSFFCHGYYFVWGVRWDWIFTFLQGFNSLYFGSKWTTLFPLNSNTILNNLNSHNIYSDFFHKNYCHSIIFITYIIIVFSYLTVFVRISKTGDIHFNVVPALRDL